ncbi:hypothetical protein G6L86_18630 [Agrobacterium tumefaciens]|uniref:hypothetical protein n=1 Tax=Agrobacterium tumefaciens TaxID=358 RepID=UPI001573764F|nr:hypothetical protein [Agrobacterium tumefaciens]NSX87623.1 hypothetical protein [Agrobacterium tumefaciens]
MSAKRDVRVRIYETIDGSNLYFLLDYPLESFGTCPDVGDTMALEFAEQKLFSVSRRYYVDNQGWAVIVRAVEPSAQSDAVLRAWQDDNEVDAEIDAAEQERVVERVQLLIGKPPADIDLNHREEPVIKKLARKSAGVRFRCGAFKGFGEGTRNNLAQRGLIAVFPSDTGRFKDDEISLTSAGATVWKALTAYRKKVEAARPQHTR